MKHAGECNPTRSMINALRYEKMGSYYIALPVVCQQCETPLCKEVCPVNAISEDLKTGAYIVNADTCLGCRLCVMACPVGGVHIDPETNVAIKCDLCDGDPLCAMFCMDGAITYVRKDKAALAKRRVAAEKMSEVLTLVAGAAT